jgi:hypothetical protein
LEPRNVVVKLGLTPDYAAYSAYDLRDQLYGYFMPKSEVTLRFTMYNKFTDNYVEQNKDLYISGYVESFEVDQFVKDPTVDLSLMCYRPELVDSNPVVFEGTTVSDLTEVAVPYEGTIPTGFVFTLYPDRTIDDFAIYHRPGNQKLYSVNFTEELLADDVIVISSVRGDKYVTLFRDGFEYQRLYSLSPASNWLELHRGGNHLRVYSAGAPVPYTLEWTTKYGGL